jgi:uncharacterized protein (DUF1778 family)
MPSTEKKRDQPLSMRLPKADIAIIDRAAGLRGRTRTAFVRDAAVRAAEDVLMENAPIRMSADGFDAFMKIMSGPGVVVPAIAEVLSRRAPWEKPTKE